MDPRGGERRGCRVEARRRGEAVRTDAHSERSPTPGSSTPRAAQIHSLVVELSRDTRRAVNGAIENRGTENRGTENRGIENRGIARVGRPLR